MQTVTGVLFEDEDVEVFKRIERWIGIHPEADEPSRRPKAGGYDTVRTDILAALRGIIEHREPLFRERLEQLRYYIDGMCEQAYEENETYYWTSRGTAIEQARVMAETRKQAVDDLREARELIYRARIVAQPSRGWATERYAGV